jgi:hypothetical protein
LEFPHEQTLQNFDRRENMEPPGPLVRLSWATLGTSASNWTSPTRAAPPSLITIALVFWIRASLAAAGCAARRASAHEITARAFGAQR